MKYITTVDGIPLVFSWVPVSYLAEAAEELHDANGDADTTEKV